MFDYYSPGLAGRQVVLISQGPASVASPGAGEICWPQSAKSFL